MEELWESLHPSPPVVLFNHAFQIFGFHWTIKLDARKLQAVGGDALRAHMRGLHACIDACTCIPRADGSTVRVRVKAKIRVRVTLLYPLPGEEGATDSGGIVEPSQLPALRT